MPFVEFPQRSLGFKIQKRLGKPNMLGWFTLGWSELGDDNIFSGVYQQRRSRKGDGAGGVIIGGDPRNFMQCPAWPSQPPSVLRDAQQAKFKTALLAWQNLTEEEKKGYNKKATKTSRRGYDMFMSQTLKSL